jgi:hypothetical protein
MQLWKQPSTWKLLLVTNRVEKISKVLKDRIPTIYQQTLDNLSTVGFDRLSFCNPLRPNDDI